MVFQVFCNTLKVEIAKQRIEYNGKTQLDVLNRQKEIKKFITEHLGAFSVKVKQGNRTFSLAYLLERDFPFFTTQGLIADPIFFSNNLSKFYPQIDRVAFYLSPANSNLTAGQRGRNKIKDLKVKIDSEEAFQAIFPSIIEEPKFKVTLVNNMLNFSHYEVSINGNSFKRISGDVFNWSLVTGRNSLSLRGVNQLKRKGQTTAVLLKYNY